MCGIAGIIGTKFVGIGQMLDVIKHRGPDSNGKFIVENISLGHQRLAIIDLSEKGIQPMYSDNGRFVIVFNGEIYNHIEIREKITDKRSFSSGSDTETILRGFEEHGTKMFARLNGIFAFALHDLTTGDIWLVRDHFGIKPLYYSETDGQFVFASEIKALLPCFDKKPTIDHRALADYLYFLWSSSERTALSDVKKLPPGHFITFNKNNPSNYSIQKYYEIPFKGQYARKTEQELTDKLDQLLQQAVKRQLLSDVPIGFFLSGGLDSSLVVAIARKLMPNEPLQCYTIDTGETNDGFAPDLPYARLLAKHLGVDLCEIKAKSDLVDHFDKIVWQMDEPQADLAPVNVKMIAEQARKDGRIVLLGGTAGDDLFSGYRRHQMLYWYPLIRSFRWLAPVAKWFGNQSAIGRRLNKAFHQIELPKKEYLARLFGWIPQAQLLELFTPKIREELSKQGHPSNILLDSLANIPDEKEPLNWMLWWEQKFYNPNHNLHYTDKMSMVHGIETRVPFLDLDLVAFAASLPVRYKMRGKTTKYLLKKVAERYLPKEVIYRPKTGFGVPLREWVRNDFREIIETRLSEKKLREGGVFEPPAVRKLIDDNLSGKIDASYTILSLLMIESWLRQYSAKAEVS